MEKLEDPDSIKTGEETRRGEEGDRDFIGFLHPCSG